MGDPTRGLYGKFYVERTDGKSAPGQKHDGCEYFILDLDHDKHAIQALRAYAASCQDEYPLLALDLRAKAEAISAKLLAENATDATTDRPGEQVNFAWFFLITGIGLTWTAFGVVLGGWIFIPLAATYSGMLIAMTAERMSNAASTRGVK